MPSTEAPASSRAPRQRPAANPCLSPTAVHIDITWSEQRATDVQSLRTCEHSLYRRRNACATTLLPPSRRRRRRHADHRIAASPRLGLIALLLPPWWFHLCLLPRNRRWALSGRRSRHRARQRRGLLVDPLGAVGAQPKQRFHPNIGTCRARRRRRGANTITKSAQSTKSPIHLQRGDAATYESTARAGGTARTNSPRYTSTSPTGDQSSTRKHHRGGDPAGEESRRRRYC